MSDHAKQQDPTPPIQQPPQNQPDDARTLADEVTLHQLPHDDEVTLTDPGSQETRNGSANQPPASELGEPTAPMPIQPATTIQVPALPADASSHMPPLLENEDTPLVAPPAAPGSIENEDTLLAIPPASAAAENAQLAGPPAPAPATPGATPIQIPASTLPPALPASRPHPFLSSEDLLAIHLVGEPQVSPDGLLIAYSIQKSDLETNTTRSSIWLVPVITGASGKLQQTRQLTSSELNSTTPRWSPDGRWLAFLSERSGSQQVYLLPLNGGQAPQGRFPKPPRTRFSSSPG